MGNEFLFYPYGFNISQKNIKFTDQITLNIYKTDLLLGFRIDRGFKTEKSDTYFSCKSQ